MMEQTMSKSNLDVNKLAEINVKTMVKICYAARAVGVKIVLVVGDSARCQNKCIEFRRNIFLTIR